MLASCVTLVCAKPKHCHRRKGFRREVPGRHIGNYNNSLRNTKHATKRQMHLNARTKEDVGEKLLENMLQQQTLLAPVRTFICR
jgi:hypothetical protein